VFSQFCICPIQPISVTPSRPGSVRERAKGVSSGRDSWLAAVQPDHRPEITTPSENLLWRFEKQCHIGVCVASLSLFLRCSSILLQFSKKVIRRSDKKSFFYCYEGEDCNKKQQLVPVIGTSNAIHHLRASYRRNADTSEIIGGTKAPKKDLDYEIGFSTE
jgi:hypothetical protein